MDCRDLPPDCDRFCLSAPGNLLLCGEYAVTEPGGQGIWLAPDLRAILHCRPAGAFRFEGRWPGGGVVWTAASPGTDMAGPPSLLQAVVDGHAALELSQSVHPGLGNWELVLDTSAFFDASGRKLGYGSSAASCLLLSAALLQLWLSGRPAAERTAAWDRFPAWAVANHRRFQGGRGSGYDVVCSLQGGIGHFIGGAEPGGQRLPEGLAALFPPFRLAEGPEAVRTAGAIARWQTWKQAHPAEAARYLEDCGRRALRLAACLDNRELLAGLEDARLAGLAIGEAIGVSAAIEPRAGDTAPNQARPDDPPAWFRKAVGAGNETIIEFLDPSVPTPSVHPGGRAGRMVRIAQRGLVADPVSCEASGHGKLLLFGEHVALYGWPACGTPLEVVTRLRFSPLVAEMAPATAEADRFPDLPPALAASATGLLARAAATLPGLAIPPGRFRVDSTVPLGSGFGSSAAFCAALARLAAAWAVEQGVIPPPPFDQDSPDRPWRLANHLDSFFHGRASGIDTGLSLADGPLAFQPAPGTPGGLDARPVHQSMDNGQNELWLVYAAVPRQNSTRELVAAIRAGMESQDPRTVHGIAALGELSGSAIALLGGQGTAADLGHLANEAQTLLGNLGLSIPALEYALAVGRAAGSPGGKLSGAGGGGAFYLWAENGPAAERIRAALEDMASAADNPDLELSVRPHCLRLRRQALTSAGSAGSATSGKTPAA